MNRFGYRWVSSAFMLSFIFAPESASKARFHFIVLLPAQSLQIALRPRFLRFSRNLSGAAPLRQGSCKCSHVYSPSFRKHSARGFRHRCPALSETRGKACGIETLSAQEEVLYCQGRRVLANTRRKCTSFGPYRTIEPVPILI